MNIMHEERHTNEWTFFMFCSKLGPEKVWLWSVENFTNRIPGIVRKRNPVRETSLKVQDSSCDVSFSSLTYRFLDMYTNRLAAVSAAWILNFKHISRTGFNEIVNTLQHSCSFFKHYNRLTCLFFFAVLFWIWATRGTRNWIPRSPTVCTLASK